MTEIWLQKNLSTFRRKKGTYKIWIMGRIKQIIRSRDGIIRRAIVKYRNAKENFDRMTERSTRKLIRIWSADDQEPHEDLGKLQARNDQLQGHID